MITAAQAKPGHRYRRTRNHGPGWWTRPAPKSEGRFRRRLDRRSLELPGDLAYVRGRLAAGWLPFRSQVRRGRETSSRWIAVPPSLPLRRVAS